MDYSEIALKELDERGLHFEPSGLKGLYGYGSQDLIIQGPRLPRSLIELFAIFHEIGHSILKEMNLDTHGRLKRPSQRLTIEANADRFARNLLSKYGLALTDRDINALRYFRNKAGGVFTGMETKW